MENSVLINKLKNLAPKKHIDINGIRYSAKLAESPKAIWSDGFCGELSERNAKNMIKGNIVNETSLNYPCNSCCFENKRKLAFEDKRVLLCPMFECCNAKDRPSHTSVRFTAIKK